MIIKSVLLEILPFLLMIVTGGFTVRVTNKHVGRHRAQVALLERAYAAEEDSRQFLKPEDHEYLATWDRILGIHTAKEPEPEPEPIQSVADVVPVALPTPSRFRTSADIQAEKHMRTREYRAKVLADMMESQEEAGKKARRQRESFDAARERDDAAIEAMRARNLAVKRFQQGWEDESRAAESAELAREAASISEYMTEVDRINAEIERLSHLHDLARGRNRPTGVLVNLYDQVTRQQIAVDIADAVQDDYGNWHLNNGQPTTPRSTS